jgi:hypothetical protein
VIIDALINVFETIVNTLLGWLPDITPPDLAGYVSALAPAFTYVGYANKYLPVDQMMVALGILTTSWMAIYIIRFVEWVLSKTHLLGGD